MATLKWVGFHMDANAPMNTIVQSIHGTKYGMPFVTFIENEPRFTAKKSLNGALYLCTEIETQKPHETGTFLISGTSTVITSVDFVPIDGGLPPNP